MEFPQPELTATNLACVAVGAAYCLGAHWALEHYILNELWEQCYLFTKDLSAFVRANLYYLLLSFPVAAYTLLSLLFSPNSTGLQLCLETDSFQLLVVFGFVVYAEESRQTALEGFLVLRDAAVYGGLLGLLGWALGQWPLEGYLGAVLLSCFVVWWVLNGLNSGLQYRVMKLFNLLNDERVVSSELLLTQEPARRDINELEDIVTDHQELIEQELDKFRLLLARAVAKERERRIHENFAMLVLSFKTAIEIQKQADRHHRADIYRRFWLPREDEYYSRPCVVGRPDEDCDQAAQSSQCEVATDKVEEVGEERSDGMGLTILKFLYLPIYALSLASGRLKYISYMLGVLLMLACMLFLNFACGFMGQGPLNPNLIMMLCAPLLGLSKLRYFLRLPGHSDYDFCNIFLQAGIAKLCLVAGIGLLLNGMVAGDFERQGLSTYIYSKGAVLGAFAIVLCAKKIVARRENFKYLMGIYLCGFAAGLGIWAT